MVFVKPSGREDITEWFASSYQTRMLRLALDYGA